MSESPSKNSSTQVVDEFFDAIVYVAEIDEQVVSYFSLVEGEEGFAGKIFWLEHIFILPEYIGKGIGSKQIATLRTRCRELKIDKVNILSDPYAKWFYDKLGALLLGGNYLQVLRGEQYQYTN